MYKLLRDSKEVKMIIAKSDNGHTEVQISGDSEVILRELLIIVTQVLKAFHSQGYADVVMKGLVDVADEFTSSINNTNFNSKGEKKDD